MRQNTKRKICSILLVIMMLVQLLPVTTLADDTNTNYTPAEGAVYTVGDSESSLEQETEDSPATANNPAESMGLDEANDPEQLSEPTTEPTLEPTTEPTPETTTEPTLEQTAEPTPEIIFHTVEFVSDNNTIKTSPIADGEIIGGELPEAPTKVGLDFVRGDYIDNTTDNIEVTANTNVTKDRTVADENVQQWTVTMDVDGEISAVTVDDGTILSTILPENPTKEGYRFVGWSEDEDTLVTSDMNIDAIFVKVWTVTFVSDEEILETRERENGEAIGVFPPDPSKEGFQFTGWISEEVTVTEDSLVQTDMLVEAQFVECLYTVSYYNEAGNAVILQQEFISGEQITSFPENPFKAGYIFMGWANADGDMVEIGYVVNDDLNLYPVFEEIKIFQVTIEYFYIIQGQETTFSSVIDQMMRGDLPKTIASPETIYVNEHGTLDEQHPYYYPTVTIRGEVKTKTYDGAPIEAGYTVSISNPVLKAEDILFNGENEAVSQTHVGANDLVLKGMFSVPQEIGRNIRVFFLISDGYAKVTPATLRISSDSDSKTYDGTPLTAGGCSVEGLADGETLPAMAIGFQKDVGTSENWVELDWDSGTAQQSDYSLQWNIGTLTVAKARITLTSATDSKVYDGVPLTNDQITVSGDGFAEGEGATYDVTGSQNLVGFSENAFTYKLNAGTNPANYLITVVLGTLKVTDGTEPDDPHPVDDDLVVTKTAEDRKYLPGEVVTFTITATNIYSEARTITLEEIEGVALAQSTFENAGPGATIATTAVYTVTEADLLAGSFINTVTATVGSLTKTATATVEMRSYNGHLTVTKETTSTAAAGDGKYALGETITYRITVTNDGNLTITDITVTDELTEDTWSIPSLTPGESAEFAASYVVTEAEILAGEVLNVATAAGASPDPENPDVPVDPGEDPEPTEEKNGHITIRKKTSSTPANGAAYTPDETITYKITVTNDGNLTITDITVTDELTEDAWSIPSLAPGENVEFSASYKVTKEDASAGSVVNVATATGTSPDPENPNVPVTPGEAKDPTKVPSVIFPTRTFIIGWFSDARIAPEGARTDALESMIEWTIEHGTGRRILALLGTGSLAGAFNDRKTEEKAVEILSRLKNAGPQPLSYFDIAGPLDVNGNEMDYSAYLDRNLLILFPI